MTALRVSFLVANCIAMASQPKQFRHEAIETIDQDFILPAHKDIYHELLREAAVKKIAEVSQPKLATIRTI